LLPLPKVVILPRPLRRTIDGRRVFFVRKAHEDGRVVTKLRTPGAGDRTP